MSASYHTTTTADGSVLHYEVHGTPTPSLPTLVFVHYYGGSPRTYDRVLSQPSLRPFHKVLYHARGWAPSTGPADPAAYAVADMSADLSAVVSAAGLGPAGYVLVGHSMGGKVAQHHAAASPAGLRGLVLAAPAPLAGLRLPPEAKAQQQAAYRSPEGVRAAVEHVLTPGPGALPEDLLQQVVRDSLRGSEQAKAAWPEYAAGEDYAGLERQIRVPALVLRGDKDFERALVGELGVDKGWVSKTVEDCGHLIPLEKPESMAAEISGFVGGI